MLSGTKMRLVPYDCSFDDTATGTNDDMEEYWGTVVTIERHTGSIGEYHIEEDGGEHYWHEDWFIPVVKNKTVVVIPREEIVMVEKIVERLAEKSVFVPDFNADAYDDKRGGYCIMPMPPQGCYQSCGHASGCGNCLFHKKNFAAHIAALRKEQ